MEIVSVSPLTIPIMAASSLSWPTMSTPSKMNHWCLLLPTIRVFSPHRYVTLIYEVEHNISIYILMPLPNTLVSQYYCPYISTFRVYMCISCHSPLILRSGLTIPFLSIFSVLYCIGMRSMVSPFQNSIGCSIFHTCW